MGAEPLPDDPTDPGTAELLTVVKSLQLAAMRAYQPIALTRGTCSPRFVREYQTLKCRLARYTALLNAARRL